MERSTETQPQDLSQNLREEYSPQHGQNIPPIPALSETNYSKWRNSIEDIFTIHDLADTLEPSYSPRPTASAAENKSFKKTIALAGQLLTSIPDEISSTLEIDIHSSTPSTIVTTIHDLYSAPSEHTHTNPSNEKQIKLRVILA